MDNAPDKANVLPLLEALKPHLGNKGQGIIDAVLDMVNLFNSESVQDILKRYCQIAPEINKEVKAVSLNTAAGKIEFSMSSFIILILLVVLLLSHQ